MSSCLILPCSISLFVRLTNSKARIKPTASLLAFDKENLIEFLLNFLHYLYKWLTLTLYQSPALPYESLLSCASIDKKIKEKKKKRILNNDLAILPSHDTTSLLSFLVPRNFSTTHNMSLPCCPFCLYLPPSILILLIFLPQLLPLPGLSSLSLFLLVSYPSIVSSFFPISPNILGCTICLTSQIISLP